MDHPIDKYLRQHKLHELNLLSPVVLHSEPRHVLQQLFGHHQVTAESLPSERRLQLFCRTWTPRRVDQREYFFYRSREHPSSLRQVNDRTLIINRPTGVRNFTSDR